MQMIRTGYLLPRFLGNGTFLPFFRASERPMAIVCFLERTGLLLLPLLSLPRFILCIAFSTSLLADGLYLRGIGEI